MTGFTDWERLKKTSSFKKSMLLILTGFILFIAGIEIAEELLIFSTACFLTGSYLTAKAWSDYIKKI